MSLLFYENQLRFQPNSESNVEQSINSSTITLQSPASFDLSFYSEKLNKSPTIHISQNSRTSPKIPSNLVKSEPDTKDNESTSLSNNTNLLNYEKDQLVQFVSEKEKILNTVRKEYDQQYENFLKLTKKFNIEKINNLKLTFKNQMLKQKIYFETELSEMSKECQRDFEKCFKTDKISEIDYTKSFKNPKDKEKHLVRVFKEDMKKLLDYMREALVNSTDTLIEAYETCQVLKSLEKIENNIQKQNISMKNSTSNLINNQINNNADRDCENSQAAKMLHKQLNDDEIRFNKYKFEMEELIHILDDIELQHLQRKDQLSTRTKFFNKLKSKFKFIENKYDILNKQCLSLRLESDVYKKLWEEKQRATVYVSNSSSVNSKEDYCSCDLIQSNQSESEGFNFCCKCSTSSSLSPSSSRSSRSSSISLLSDENQLDDQLELEDDISSLSSTSSSSEEVSSSTSSSSSLLSSNHDYQEESEHFVEDADEIRDPASYLSTNDYNRKLDIVKNLINLHVSKSTYSKDSSASSSSTLLTINNLWRQAQTIDSLSFNNEINVLTHASSNIRHGDRQNSSLDLSNCSLDGERVVIENSNLKLDYDISEWYLTRQIESMPVNKYKLPYGSLIKSGKILRIHAPFQSSPVDFLLAIKQQNIIKNNNPNNNINNNTNKSRLNLKVFTKLISPDGSIKAVHCQEIPQFYQEIFKYANLIRLL